MSFPRSWKLDSQNIEFRWKRGFRWTRLLLNRGCEKSRNKEGDSFHPRLCSSFISHTRPSPHFFLRSKVPLRITQEIPRRGPILIDSLTPTRFNSAPRAFPNEDVALSSSLCRYVGFFLLFVRSFLFRAIYPATHCGNFGNFLRIRCYLSSVLDKLFRSLSKQFFIT